MVINSEKISRFLRCALRPALDAFLRDIGGKIMRIRQCCALDTALSCLVLLQLSKTGNCPDMTEKLLTGP